MSQTPPIVAGAVERPAGSGLAIASIVLGVLGFCTMGLTALVGLVLGIIALAGAGGPGGARGKAIAGVVLSGIGLVVGPMMILVLALMLPAVAMARMNAVAAAERSNMRQLGVAVFTYAADSEGRFPPAATWFDTITEGGYLGDPAAPGVDPVALSPLQPEAGRAYAMNAALDGRGEADVTDPTRTVVLFEIDPGGPMAGGPELLPAQPRCRSGYGIIFADGHFEYVLPETLDQLVWEP